MVLATGVAGASGEPRPGDRPISRSATGGWSSWKGPACGAGPSSPPEHQQQEEIYGSLWRSLVRWLVANVGLLPSQRLALRADKLTFGTDENRFPRLLPCCLHCS